MTRAQRGKRTPHVTTYKAAGVDVDSAERFVSKIGRIAAVSHRPEVLSSIGGFGGLFRFNAKQFKDPVLVSSGDGVGTKLMLATTPAHYRALGVDLVAMNVNDILAVGAEPLFFVDYLAIGDFKESMMSSLLKGIASGCLEAGCALVGGETAQMPSIYSNGMFEMAGFAVGVVERSRLIDGSAIRAGDRLIGIGSSGPHANGFSLIRSALSQAKLRALSSQLLKPTRIYVKPVLEVLKRHEVHGVAHITGGSFQIKLRRILPHNVSAVIRRGGWRIPRVFQTIQQAGRIHEDEMYQTFNMGIGCVLAVPPAVVKPAQRILSACRFASWEIGFIEHGGKEVVLCR